MNLKRQFPYSSNAPYATLQLDQYKSRTRIQISDKGEGIEPAYIKKIFDKFFRVPKGDKHDVKGFGLGLFYVKNICDAHKWEISIESKVGEGTVVTLLL